jgi:hypothetical protein
VPVALIVLAMAVACTSTAPAPDASQGQGRQGKVELEVLSNLEVSRSHDPGHEWRGATPNGELEMPVLPEHLLDGGFERGTIAVRVTVSTAGDVVSVEDSPLASSSAGEHVEELKLAVERSVRQWHFWPAEVRRIEDGPEKLDQSNRQTEVARESGAA